MSRRRRPLGSITGALVKLVCTDRGRHAPAVLAEVSCIDGMVIATAESHRRHETGPTTTWVLRCPDPTCPRHPQLRRDRLTALVVAMCLAPGLMETIKPGGRGNDGGAEEVPR